MSVLVQRLFRDDVSSLPPRRHEVVVDKLTRQIVIGQLAPGAPLPPEPSLADQFGVSRTVIREAVRLLAAKGLVAVKHGSGVWVQESDAWDSLDPSILLCRLLLRRDLAILDQALEARRIVEVEVAGLAALRRTAEDVEALTRIMTDLRAATTPHNREAFLQGDVAFHGDLFRIARNVVLRKMFSTTLTLFQVANTLHARRTLPVATSQAGHEGIYRAVREGDAGAAREAMQQHISQASEDIRRSLLTWWDSGSLAIDVDSSMNEPV